jgi:4-carboxymuconolactone decarboxylase
MAGHPFDNPTLARDNFGDIAPDLAKYTDEVLFQDLWKRPGLGMRDRSLITITTLIALARVNELRPHLGIAITNGVTKEEIIEVITHLAFYAGWPAAMTALGVAREVLFGGEAKYG